MNHHEHGHWYGHCPLLSGRERPQPWHSCQAPSGTETSNTKGKVCQKKQSVQTWSNMTDTINSYQIPTLELWFNWHSATKERVVQDIWTAGADQDYSVKDLQVAFHGVFWRLPEPALPTVRQMDPRRLWGTIHPKLTNESGCGCQAIPQFKKREHFMFL